jgi:hypothetical protein
MQAALKFVFRVEHFEASGSMDDSTTLQRRNWKVASGWRVIPTAIRKQC